jgi:hypothetical protein
MAGVIKLTTGITGIIASTAIIHIALSKPYKNMVVNFSPANGNAAALYGPSAPYVYCDPDFLYFELISGSVPLDIDTIYIWNYIVSSYA